MRNKQSQGNKENRMSLERRLSLKYSSAQTKNNPRLSGPVRRDSIGALSSVTALYENKQPRQSLISMQSQPMARPMKKQAIITNLVHKLEHQDNLKAIIESKIKKSTLQSSTCYTDDTQYMTEKLHACESQIETFKELVHHLTEKISYLEQSTKGEKKRKIKQIGVQTDDPRYITEGNNNEDHEFFYNLDRTLKVLSNKKNF